MVIWICRPDDRVDAHTYVPIRSLVVHSRRRSAFSVSADQNVIERMNA